MSGRMIESVESYVIRIYRRHDNRLEGLIERPLIGERKLFHSADELWRALIESVSDPSTCPAPENRRLTARQLAVLSYICRGKDNREIAAAFGVSYRTIKTHVSAILKTLGVANRTQAVLAAHRMGLRTD